MFTDPIVFAFDEGFKEVTGLADYFINGQIKQMVEDLQDSIKFTFKDVRELPAEAINSPGFQQRLKYYENLLQSYSPYGYDEEKQNVGLLLEGNQTKVLNTTMTALNLTLQELTEVEKKQLEGFWNLPSGTTAYVPITSLFYQQQASSSQTIPESTAIAPQPTDVNVQVNIEPTTVNVQVDGKVVANAVTRQQSRVYSETYKGVGRGLSGDSYIV